MRKHTRLEGLWAWGRSSPTQGKTLQLQRDQFPLHTLTPKELRQGAGSKAHPQSHVQGGWNLALPGTDFEREA